MRKNNKELGDEGEKIAIDFLESKGFEILEKKYHFGKGEIDIIAKDTTDSFLVFIEVKMRQNLNYGEPEYAITPSKIKQIRKVAAFYLYQHKIEEIDCRFDVVAIIIRNNLPPNINHIRNAF